MRELLFCWRFWNQPALGGFAGPLEKTVISLESEVAAKGAASRALQRRWLEMQAELVVLLLVAQRSTAHLAALHSKHAVLKHRAQRITHLYVCWPPL